MNLYLPVSPSGEYANLIWSTQISKLRSESQESPDIFPAIGVRVEDSLGKRVSS